jgi:hypothetical protein
MEQAVTGEEGPADDDIIPYLSLKVQFVEVVGIFCSDNETSKSDLFSRMLGDGNFIEFDELVRDANRGEEVNRQLLMLMSVFLISGKKDKTSMLQHRRLKLSNNTRRFDKTIVKEVL